MTDDELAELERLASEATPGKWDERIAFIAAAREAVPKLCAALREARASDAESLRMYRSARDRAEQLSDELCAYKKAKSENDERYIIERDEARAEVSRLGCHVVDITIRDAEIVNRLRAELERQRDVVAAAKAWRATFDNWSEVTDADIHLVHQVALAVDALLAAEAHEGEP